ncbi:MAG: hypothetical protein ACQCXQ_01030 [Verrucomicrobiales bacterium]|nr:hypothetical protein [Verrucomicrobiota bacterium JB025]
MTRFGLILDTLGALDRSELPHPGDADIRHGCERALTAILLELARIEPVVQGSPLETTDNNPLTPLYSATANKLIDSDQLLRMEQFIHRILGMPSNFQ